MDKYRGLSLDFCVSDLMKKKLKLQQVLSIEWEFTTAETGTKNQAIEFLCKNVWTNDPEGARDIVRALFTLNKIIPSQPRVEGFLTKGPWLLEEVQGSFNKRGKFIPYESKARSKEELRSLINKQV